MHNKEKYRKYAVCFGFPKYFSGWAHFELEGRAWRRRHFVECHLIWKLGLKSSLKIWPILLVEQGLGSMHNMTIANERLFSKYHNIKGQGDRVKKIQNPISVFYFSPSLTTLKFVCCWFLRGSLRAGWTRSLDTNIFLIKPALNFLKWVHPCEYTMAL